MKRSSRPAAILFVFGAAVLRPAPAISDTISSTDSFLPAVHINGASGVYRTDVTIFNPDPAVDAVVDIAYGEADRDGTTRPVYRIPGNLGPLASVTLPDIVLSTFGLGSSYGLLEVRSSSGTPVHVTSNTYNVAGAVPGTYGQFSPGQPFRNAVGFDNSIAGDLYVTGIPNDENHRTNAVVMNPTGIPLEAAVRLWDAAGVPFKTVLVGVPPYSLHQLNDIFNADFASASPPARRPLAAQRLRQPPERRARSLLRDRDGPPHRRPLPPDRSARPPLKRPDLCARSSSTSATSSSASITASRWPDSRQRPGSPEGDLRPHLFGPLEAEFDLGRLTAGAFFRAVERAAGPSVPPRRASGSRHGATSSRPFRRPSPPSAASRGTSRRFSSRTRTPFTGKACSPPCRSFPASSRLRALSFEVGAAKPDAAHFAAALALAGARAEDAAVRRRPARARRGGAAATGSTLFVESSPRGPRDDAAARGAPSRGEKRKEKNDSAGVLPDLRERPRGVPGRALLRGPRGVGAALEETGRATTGLSAGPHSARGGAACTSARGNPAARARASSPSRRKSSIDSGREMDTGTGQITGTGRSRIA